MVQAPGLDGLSLDPLPFQQDGWTSPEVDIGRGQVAQALMISVVIVVLDEGLDLDFEMAGQIIVLQQDPVLQRLVPTFDLALRLGMMGCSANVLHAFFVKEGGQTASDIA